MCGAHQVTEVMSTNEYLKWNTCFLQFLSHKKMFILPRTAFKLCIFASIFSSLVRISFPCFTICCSSKLLIFLSNKQMNVIFANTFLEFSLYSRKSSCHIGRFEQKFKCIIPCNYDSFHCLLIVVILPLKFSQNK